MSGLEDGIGEESIVRIVFSAYFGDYLLYIYESHSAKVDHSFKLSTRLLPSSSCRSKSIEAIRLICASWQRMRRKECFKALYRIDGMWDCRERANSCIPLTFEAQERQYKKCTSSADTSVRADKTQISVSFGFTGEQRGDRHSDQLIPRGNRRSA